MLMLNQIDDIKGEVLKLNHTVERCRQGAARSPRPRHFGLRLGVVLLITLDTIRRLFRGVTPFDWVMLAVEVVILLLIAGEFIAPVFHRARIHRRGARVTKLLEAGLLLSNTVPPTWVEDTKARIWVGQVENWIGSTRALLSSYSLLASIAFQQGDAARPTLVNPVAVALTARAAYMALLVSLNSLRTIVENPEAYL